MIVLDADRLSRNMDDASVINRDFNKIGVQIIYVADEKLDLTTKEGKLMNAMKSYGAQAFTDGHSLKIKAGLERARQEGKKIGRPLKRDNSAINPDMLIEFAKHGYSIRDLQSVYKVSRTTISRRLVECGKMDEFKAEYKKAKEKAQIQNSTINH